MKVRTEAIDTKNEEMTEILVKSSIDGTMQPNLVYISKNENRPLLVGLHTWSYGRFNQAGNMLPLAIKNDWNLLLPEFRGANLRSNPDCKDALGSKKAKQDIVDAVEYVKENYNIDSSKIMLLGASGGGHMALLMAGYMPKMWKAVCSFVPITDVGKWYFENPNYSDGIAACCGEYEDSKDEYDYRSPVSYVKEIAQATVKIYSGKWDNSVPCHHGLDLYNKIFSEYPEANVYFEMFDGGHEMLIDDAERWLIAHLNDKKDDFVKVTG